MKTINCLTIIAFGVIVLSCNTTANQMKLMEVQAERDSLLLLSQQQDSIKAVLDTYVETIALTLDSIKTQEQILTVKVDESGRRLRKQEIKDNLALLATIITRQRERIEIMESQLLRQGLDSSSHYRTIISHLYDEIDAKNAKIAEMSLEIQRQSQTINRLNNRVTNLESDVNAISLHAKEQAETIALQDEILSAQNDQLNTGYLMVGTRKELQNAGLVSKGLFNGGRLNSSNIDLSQFDQIDIRYFSEITVNGKNIKLLSPHPASSYSIEYLGNGESLLLIKDPAVFWSISNYIIIQN